MVASTNSSRNMSSACWLRLLSCLKRKVSLRLDQTDCEIFLFPNRGLEVQICRRSFIGSLCLYYSWLIARYPITPCHTTWKSHLIRFARVLFATYSNSFRICVGICPSAVRVIEDGSIGRFNRGILHSIYRYSRSWVYTFTTSCSLSAKGYILR